jgi:Ca2+/Na+ antiporter
MKERVDEISVRMSNSLSAITLVLMVIGTYVLLFSSVSILYKIVIVVYIFVLLFLFSLALQSLETIGKPRAE